MPGKILQNCEHEGHLDPPFGKHYHFSFDLITGVTPYNMTLVVHRFANMAKLAWSPLNGASRRAAAPVTRRGSI